MCCRNCRRAEPSIWRRVQAVIPSGWRNAAGMSQQLTSKIGEIPGVKAIRADLEKHEYRVAPSAWDLIVCWLYWQSDLLPEIARGVRPGGVVAIAGKTSGRFATSLAQLREGFDGWREIASGENERCFLVAAKELVD